MAKDAMKKDLDQKQILLVLGLFVVLAGILLYFFVLSGGEEPADLGAPPLTEETPSVLEEPEELEEPDEGPVETFEVFTRRDPFEPVIDITGGEAGPIGNASPEPGTSPSPSPSPTSNVFDDDDDNGTNERNGGNGTNSSGQSIGGHTVKLVDVFGRRNHRRAQVQVDGTVYTVDPGETFAQSFRLVSISGQCASMLFGDDQFTICEGDQIIK